MADRSKYAESKSNFLKAKDFVGKRVKVTIDSTEEIHYDASENGPERDLLALKFKGKEKKLLLNATNTQILCDAYGPDDDTWIGHEIGLSVADYQSKGFGFGWVIEPLDVEKPEYVEDDIPF